VGVENKASPGTAWGYLVTAKHVLKDVHGNYFTTVWVRINKQAGGVESLSVTLVPSGPNKNVFVHDDASVDLVVIPVSQPDPKVYELVVVEDTLLSSKQDFKDLGIGEGSDVFFTGMFLPHLGTNRNYPIVRFGKVALLSEEKISWNGTPTELYLMETLAFGGNSGSPVFFYLGLDRLPGSLVVGAPTLKMAGVVLGFFNDLEPIVAIETNSVAVAKLNSGIAAVIPAYLLHEILYGQELKAKRSH
jgi:hypothetical protein